MIDSTNRQFKSSAKRVAPDVPLLAPPGPLSTEPPIRVRVRVRVRATVSLSTEPRDAESCLTDQDRRV